MTPIKRFINLLRVDKKDIMSIYIYAFFSGVVTLSLPLGIQAIINLIRGGQVSTSWIILVVFVIAGVAFTGILQIMQLTISENIQQKIFTRSSFEFAYRIPRMKQEAVSGQYIPELVNRFFDTLSVQKGLSKILMDFSTALLQVFFGLVLLSLYHPFFILFSFALITIVYLIFKFTVPNGIKTSLKESKHKYEVAHWLEELARMTNTFKLAGNSKLPLEKTDVVVEEYLSSRKSHFKTLLLQYINLVGFKVIIAAGLLLIGGLLVINEQMNIGQFVASEIIIILVLGSVEKLISGMENIYDVLTAIEKIGTVADIPLEKDTKNPVSVPDSDGLSIQMNQLSYQFPDTKQPVLHKVDLSITAGEKICLSGSNGSGKTMLFGIIAGLFERFTGNLTYNNIPLGNWQKTTLRSILGNGFSQDDVFQGTVYENLTLGKPDLSFDQVQQAAEIVGLSEFIANLTDGYQTSLIAEDHSLPRSIRLKIKLVRAIIGHPKLVLIEDNFNQLNIKDKDRILDYLLQQNFTVLIISNDPYIAFKMDRVMVMDHGALQAEGKLEEFKNQDWYSELFKTS